MNYTTPIPFLYNNEHQLQNQNQPNPRKRPNKVHVSAACVNCKKAHLACDVSRPCQRCISTDKADTCHDIQHKKRGRPKMLRDSNNNKIRPVSANTTPGTNYRVISFPSDLSSSSLSPHGTMTILLSMDLCCARVTDESLEFLQLYPQEFSHRSIYDFLAPGESAQNMSKIHRCLLDNASQHQQKKAPPSALRSSFEAFHSSPLDALLNIANGSLTLKQKLKFLSGSHHSTEEEMNCNLYLGGGLGADLFDANSLTQLYIVCVLSPTKPVIRENSNVGHISIAPPVSSNNTSVSSITTPTSTLSTSTSTTSTVPIPLTATPMFTLPPLILNESSSTTSPSTTNYSYTEEEEDAVADMQQHDDTTNYFMTHNDMIDKRAISDSLKSKRQTDDENEDVKSTLESCGSSPTETAIVSTAEEMHSVSKHQSILLDKFRYNSNRSKQFIHPNELYYLKTTSSRLSSEAIARTAYPYLSAKLSENIHTSGSSSLAAYNSSLKQ